MKKIIYTFLDLLTIAFLIGGYVFQYFTRKKLGMLRWVNYQNMQIQKNPVYDILKYITVAAAIVLIVLIIVGYRKKKEWKIKNCGYLSEWSFWFCIKSHIWLVFLSGKYRESEIPGKHGTGKFSVGDWHLYHTYHHKLCGTCTSGGDICNRCRSGIWTGTWNHLLFRSDYTWGYGSICCRKIFLTGHY